MGPAYSGADWATSSCAGIVRGVDFAIARFRPTLEIKVEMMLGHCKSRLGLSWKVQDASEGDVGVGHKACIGYFRELFWRAPTRTE